MNTSLVILFMGVLLAVLSHYAEARPTSVQKTMSFLRKRMLNTRLTRSAFMSKEEDEEYEEDEEEEEENNNWGSKEDAELFLGIFDLNNDGKIDEPELWAFFEALSYDEVDIKQLVEKVFLMDIDHNAYLSTEELANAMAKGYL